MNKEFCIQCGHKNVFEVSRPKFCAGCGTPFNTSSASTLRNAPKVERYHEEDDDDESETLSSIDISKLRNTITVEASQNKVSLDDLWRNPSPYEQFDRPQFNGPDGEDLIKQIQRECASSKMTEIDE